MAKRIIIKGGLGNQLFQYAYGRKLEIINKKKVIFDISFFYTNNKDTSRPFLLDQFNINPLATFIKKPEDFLITLIKKIFHNITGRFPLYQSEKYFIEIKDQIFKEFIPRNPMSKEVQEIINDIRSRSNSISIHIRRGDYVNNKHHNVCDLDYYYRAIEYTKTKTENPFFFIFSDDIDWVKENLELENSIYISNPDLKEYEEMILMSECKHNIIANSTFSWWSAYLNKNYDKIIIAPKQWTVSKTADKLRILPKNWIQI